MSVDRLRRAPAGVLGGHGRARVKAAEAAAARWQCDVNDMFAGRERGGAAARAGVRRGGRDIPGQSGGSSVGILALGASADVLRALILTALEDAEKNPEAFAARHRARR